MKRKVEINVIFILSIFTLTAHASSFISVDNSTKYFIDPDGRTRIFHGVNAVFVFSIIN